MSLPPQLIDEIASPPLAPGEEPIDLSHLTRMTLGDTGLAREVLAMFLKQTAGLLTALAARPADSAALAHTLKGSARAIGAFRVAAAAAALETAVGAGEEPSRLLAALDAAAAETSAAIGAILASP